MKRAPVVVDAERCILDHLLLASGPVNIVDIPGATVEERQRWRLCAGFEGALHSLFRRGIVNGVSRSYTVQSGERKYELILSMSVLQKLALLA